jgi:hypothetical protein
MIYLKIVRMAHCEHCGKEWQIADPDNIPVECRYCTAPIWLEGAVDQKQIRVRHGHTKRKKNLNPGAAHRNRQIHGKKQYRQFKPKPVDEKPQQSDDSATSLVGRDR